MFRLGLGLLGFSVFRGGNTNFFMKAGGKIAVVGKSAIDADLMNAVIGVGKLIGGMVNADVVELADKIHAVFLQQQVRGLALGKLDGIGKILQAQIFGIMNVQKLFNAVAPIGNMLDVFVGKDVLMHAARQADQACKNIGAHCLHVDVIAALLFVNLAVKRAKGGEKGKIGIAQDAHRFQQLYKAFICLFLLGGGSFGGGFYGKADAKNFGKLILDKGLLVMIFVGVQQDDVTCLGNIFPLVDDVAIFAGYQILQLVVGMVVRRRISRGVGKQMLAKIKVAFNASQWCRNFKIGGYFRKFHKIPPSKHGCVGFEQNHYTRLCKKNQADFKKITDFLHIGRVLDKHGKKFYLQY